MIKANQGNKQIRNKMVRKSDYYRRGLHACAYRNQPVYRWRTEGEMNNAFAFISISRHERLLREQPSAVDYVRISTVKYDAYLIRYTVSLCRCIIGNCAVPTRHSVFLYTYIYMRACTLHREPICSYKPSPPRVWQICRRLFAKVPEFDVFVNSFPFT